MKVVKKEPNKDFEIVDIENTLKALQEAVGGYIETVTITEDCCIICDEEGKLKGKENNITLFGIDFVGTILFVGVSGDEFTDFPHKLYEFLIL